MVARPPLYKLRLIRLAMIFSCRFRDLFVVRVINVGTAAMRDGAERRADVSISRADARAQRMRVLSASKPSSFHGV